MLAWWWGQKLYLGFQQKSVYFSAIADGAAPVAGNDGCVRVRRRRPTGASQQQTRRRRRREAGGRLQPLRLQIPEAPEAEEVGSRPHGKHLHTWLVEHITYINYYILSPIYYYILQAISKCTTHVTWSGHSTCNNKRLPSGGAPFVKSPTWQ